MEIRSKRAGFLKVESTAHGLRPAVYTLLNARTMYPNKIVQVEYNKFLLTVDKDGVVEIQYNNKSVMFIMLGEYSSTNKRAKELQRVMLMIEDYEYSKEQEGENE